jgi:hypothetical protein
MISSRMHFRRVCALVTAALVLPALAYADKDKGDKGDKGDKSENKGSKGDPRVSSVPEANAGWVLVPFFGLVLLFSARQFFPKKATE